MAERKRKRKAKSKRDKKNKGSQAVEPNYVADEIMEYVDRFFDMADVEQPCKRCGQCCRCDYLIGVTQKEIDAEPSLADNAVDYTAEEREATPNSSHCIKRIRYKDGTKECIYLTDNGCSIYETRPALCVGHIPTPMRCNAARVNGALNQKVWYENVTKMVDLEGVTSVTSAIDKILMPLIIPFLISPGDPIDKENFVFAIDKDREIPEFIREFMQSPPHCKTMKDLPIMKEMAVKQG